VVDVGSLQGFPYYGEFGEHLRRELPGVVKTTTPVLYTYGIFRVPATAWTKPARVLGVRLDDYVKVNAFRRGLHYERYYPGTTSLRSQRLPVAGFTDDGLRLPEDLQAANARWRQQEADAKKIAEYDAKPFEKAPYPDVTPWVAGDRVYSADIGPPRYDGSEREGIIIGYDLLFERRPDGAFDRYLVRGADVALTLLPLSPAGNPLGEPPVKVPLRYADDSRTGIYEIDSLCVYVDFDMLQKRLAMDPQTKADGGTTRPRANQLLVDVDDAQDLDAIRDRIAEEWSRFRASLADTVDESDDRMMSLVGVYTWEDMQRSFIQAVEKEKVLVTFLFTLISVVAIVLVGCIFYMIVEKKTKDVGILKSLGASSAGVAGLFILYAAFVGLVGSILGSALGATVVWYINDIQDFLAFLNPSLRVWSPDIYSFDKIPNVVKTPDVLWIGSVAVISSIIGSLIPARIAARIWPVAALRYE
jgi:ABC-type lipoprotein release transport system permease subunit